jgi:tetratricopeptide (TPR) repeat protein
MNNLLKVFILIIVTFNFAQSQTLRTLVNEGVDSYQKNNYEDAEVNFRKGIEQKTDEFIPHFNLGDAYYKQGKYDEAIKSYQQSIAKTDDKSSKAKALYNIGNSLIKSDKLKESVEAYKNSLKLNPSDKETKYNLSYALKKLEQQQNEQNQQDKNQNKDQKDKNDNKDPNKNDKDNKQDKENQKDKNNQNDQQPPKDQEAKQDQTQQKQQEKMSKEEAERVLNALKENEKDIQKKLRKKTGVRVKTDKDW